MNEVRLRILPPQALQVSAKKLVDYDSGGAVSISVVVGHNACELKDGDDVRAVRSSNVCFISYDASSDSRSFCGSEGRLGRDVFAQLT